jgi:hypothetical protein
VTKAKHLLSTAIMISLFLNVLALPAHAGVLTFNETTGGNGTNANQTVGWEFNVLRPITVDDLEWYDPNRTTTGLSTAHMVGIWSPTGILLTSVLIPAGTAAPLDGMFASESVTPLTLAVGNGYVVGGQNFSTNTDRLACGNGMGGNCGGPLTETLDPRLAFVNTNFSTITPVSMFVEPILVSSGLQGFFGPSFSAVAVPAPSIGNGLFVLLAVAVVLFHHKLRRI